MTPSPIGRMKNSAVGIAMLAAIALLAAFPDRALLILGMAQLATASACAPAVRTSLNQRPPAVGAAIVFAALTLFWAGMAMLFFWQYFDR